MVHMASVWVPFTSESKEAIASYPEIQKELRLALQTVGRKLGMYLRRRLRVKQEGERRQIFLRYLGEVAKAVSDINRVNRDDLYAKLLAVAKKKTADADVELDERGRPVEDATLDLGKNVLIIGPEPIAPAVAPEAAAIDNSAKERTTKNTKSTKEKK
jgi:DNA topoisomerase-6 subunit B